MTARVMIACDGDWSGFPCRGAYPVPAARYATIRSGGDLTDLYAARIEAFTQGWSNEDDRDYCPAHTHARAAAAIQEIATATLTTRDRMLSVIAHALDVPRVLIDEDLTRAEDHLTALEPARWADDGGAA